MTKQGAFRYILHERLTHKYTANVSSGFPAISSLEFHSLRLLPWNLVIPVRIEEIWTETAKSLAFKGVAQAISSLLRLRFSHCRSYVRHMLCYFWMLNVLITIHCKFRIVQLALNVEYITDVTSRLSGIAFSLRVAFVRILVSYVGLRVIY